MLPTSRGQVHSQTVGRGGAKSGLQASISTSSGGGGQQVMPGLQQMPGNAQRLTGRTSVVLSQLNQVLGHSAVTRVRASQRHLGGKWSLESSLVARVHDFKCFVCIGHQHVRYWFYVAYLLFSDATVTRGEAVWGTSDQQLLFQFCVFLIIL